MSNLFNPNYPNFTLPKPRPIGWWSVEWWIRLFDGGWYFMELGILGGFVAWLVLDKKKTKGWKILWVGLILMPLVAKLIITAFGISTCCAQLDGINYL